MATVGSWFVEDGHIDKISNLNEDSKGKVIYEVLRIINGKPLFLEEHIERMKKSFQLVEVGFYYENYKIVEFINALIESNNLMEGNIKIIFDTELETMKLFFLKHSYPTKEMYDNGVKTILYKAERENPNAKIVNNDFREKINKKIKDEKAFEAILVSDNSKITEGSKSNIFFIKGDEVLTSKVDSVLPGITRGEIIELCKELDILVREIDIDSSFISEIDAAFISGTSPKILPIKTINDVELDEKNELLRKLMNKFDEKIKGYINN